MPINFLWCPSKCMNGHNKYTVCLLYNQACFAKASLFTVHGKETNFSTHYSTIKLNYIPSNDVKMLWELHSLPSISHSSHSYKLYITILCCTYSVLHDIFISFVNRKMVEMEFVLSMNARTFSFPFATHLISLLLLHSFWSTRIPDVFKTRNENNLKWNIKIYAKCRLWICSWLL